MSKQQISFIPHFHVLTAAEGMHQTLDVESAFILLFRVPHVESHVARVRDKVENQHQAERLKVV